MGTGKKKIEIKQKNKIQERMVAFSKRRRGLFKKANELYQLYHAKIAAIAYSPAGKPYIYGDPFFHIVKHYCSPTTKFCSSSGDDFCSSNSSVSDTDNEEVEEDKLYEEFENWMTWLRAMELDVCDNAAQLLPVKNDLEKIRDKLINSIDDLN